MACYKLYVKIDKIQKKWKNKRKIRKEGAWGGKLFS